MHKLEYYSKEFSIPCQKIYENGIRTRANFAMYHIGDKLHYSMFENKQRVLEFNLDFLDKDITNFMPLLLEEIKDEYKHKLFEVRFFKTSFNLGVLMLYHKDISNLDIQDFHTRIQKLSNLEIKLTFQARNQRFSYPNDELVHISNDNKYYFNDECFIQPSLGMNENMLNFAKSCLDDKKCDDLLELYCGYGNFTLALAPYFKKVLATELSKKNVYFLNKNTNSNNIFNIKTARMKDSEIKDALEEVREFNRLKNIDLKSYNFSHIMLDPPRCGLGDCVYLANKFNNIIYISCNPISAKKDLEILEKTHSLKRFVLFDQFLNSEHLECGFYLEKR